MKYNLKLDLDASGHSIESLSQDRIVEYLRGELTIVELTYPNLTHIVVSDEIVELGSAIDDGSFDVAEWSGVLGNNLSENIHAVLNNQNIAAADRWSAAEIDIADLISEGLSTLQSNATLQSEVLERFGGANSQNTSLERTSADGLVLSGPNDVTLTLTANNLSGDLVSLIDAFNEGDPISSVLSQSITGQINSLVLDDAVSGTSVGLHFTNTDGDVQNA